MLDPGVARRLAADPRRIVVTGAGGWLGLCTLQDLVLALGDRFADRVVCVGSSRRILTLEDGRAIEQIALDDIGQLPKRPTMVLHFAFLTKDRAVEMSEADYRQANARISQTVAENLERIGADAIFVASSGAAYRARDLTAAPEMRLYGELKEADEDRFAAWAQAHGTRAVIARVFNVSGPYINKHQAYALASFILDGLAGRSITVRAPRSVVRGYVAISELMSLALAEVMAASDGVSRFDSGGLPLELGDVARVVAAQVPGAQVTRADVVESVPDVYHGDPQAYAAMLSRHHIAATALDAQIAKTIDYLRRQQ
jgi:nucleoside-diphosphate-sugar epimerase